jgi:hypothetical protein
MWSCHLLAISVFVITGFFPYNVLIDFGTPMKPIGLIKMCLNKTYSKVRKGKNLLNVFPIQNGLKQGDDLSSFILTLL